MTHRLSAAIDPAVETLREADHLAGLLREFFARQPAGAPDWVVSHWIDHDPGTGGAHLALSLEWSGDGGAEPGPSWECLQEAAALVAAEPAVFGTADELGVAAAGRAAGLAGLAASARGCLDVLAARSSGRAIVFPGSADIAAELTVADLVEATAIDDVAGLGALPVEPDTIVHTFAHVRPVFRGGDLVLTVVPFGGGTGASGVTPFEVRDPTPCCAFH